MPTQLEYACGRHSFMIPFQPINRHLFFCEHLTWCVSKTKLIRLTDWSLSELPVLNVPVEVVVIVRAISSWSRSFQTSSGRQTSPSLSATSADVPPQGLSAFDITASGETSGCKPSEETAPCCSSRPDHQEAVPWPNRQSARPMQGSLHHLPECSPRQ